MSYPASNVFTTFSLTPDELTKGQQLTSLNVAFIQNLRSQLAEEKLNLVFTPNDINTYLQQEAHLKGQLDVLSYILSCNEEASRIHTVA